MSSRKFCSSQTAQTRASMATEYQRSFLPPTRHMALITTSIQKNPYHPLKGTTAEMTTFKSYYTTHKWIKNSPKAPQPPLPPKVQLRCSSTPLTPARSTPARSVANQMGSKVEDYTSVYRNDFRAWKAKKRLPFKLNDNLKVKQDVLVTNGTNPNKEEHSQKKSVQEVREPQPFESITSYRADFVVHPLPPRTRREKPVYQTSKGLPLEHAVPSRPKAAWDINQERFDEACSLETKFHGKGKTKESSSAADHHFLSTTHADYTPHKCQYTKPVLPAMQTIEISKEPFQGLTTMKEDYKAWDTPRRKPSVRKEDLDWPTWTTFSVCTPKTPKTPESCKTNPQPCSLHPKFNETRVSTSSCTATQKPQCPAENGAFSSFSISTGSEESRRYWTASVDRGGAWPTDEICEEAHQIISCVGSSRN